MKIVAYEYWWPESPRIKRIWRILLTRFPICWRIEMKYILLAVLLTFSVQVNAECTNWTQKFQMTLIKGHAGGLSEKTMVQLLIDVIDEPSARITLLESFNRIYPTIVQADLDMEEAIAFEKTICP